jgi:hypothetical protein
VGRCAKRPHAEQFIVTDEPSLENSSASKDQAYRVMIVPTAAVGASPLKRTYPQVISFRLPDQKAGKDFKGTIGEANDDPDETYLSLMTRVVNEQLVPYQKTLIDASSTATPAKDASVNRTRCDAVFKYEEDNKAKKDVKGEIYLLIGFSHNSSHV